MVSLALQSRALKIMNKLCSRPIAQLFLKEPTDSSGTEIFNLFTVRKKLMDNCYANISEWKSDVAKVFDTVISQEKNPNLVNVSFELKTYFEEITKEIKETIDETWRTKLGFLHKDLILCVRELLKCRPGSSQKQRTVVKRDQLNPIIEELPPAQFRRHFTPLNKEELTELMNKLNELKDKKMIQKVYMILKENESSLFEKNKSNQMDLSLFKPETLQTLKEIFVEEKGK